MESQKSVQTLLESALATIREVRSQLKGTETSRNVLLPDVGDVPRVVFVEGQGFVLASADLPPWRFAELHRHPEPAWIPCPGCDAFVCTVHDCHAFECDCPRIEDWEFNPYAPVPPGKRLLTPAKKEKTP